MADRDMSQEASQGVRDMKLNKKEERDHENSHGHDDGGETQRQDHATKESTPTDKAGTSVEDVFKGHHMTAEEIREKQEQNEAAKGIQSAWRRKHGKAPSSQWVELEKTMRLRKAADFGGGAGGGDGSGGDAKTMTKKKLGNAETLLGHLTGDANGSMSEATSEADTSATSDDDLPDGQKKELSPADAKARDERRAAREERRSKRREQRRAAQKESSKNMGESYWLEMVDGKHRYGSHLKWYHQYWLDNVNVNEGGSESKPEKKGKGGSQPGRDEAALFQPGDGNFFKWLDHGGGKDLSLPKCPRDLLEKDRVSYLSREQRQQYLVKIVEGRLTWFKNGERITTSVAFADSEQGIVPKEEVESGRIKARSDGQTEAYDREEERRAAGGHSEDKGEEEEEEEGDDTSSESGSSAGSGEKERHYGFPGPGGRPLDKLKINPQRLEAALLKKTLSKNTWIFVTDAKMNMYVGKKQSGKFQHSSFLYGAKVTSAGLIKIQDGQIRSLSPLSGHYKCSTVQFQAFLDHLRDRNTDLSKVKIKKSWAMLHGIEMYGKFLSSTHQFKARVKDKLTPSHHDKE